MEDLIRYGITAAIDAGHDPREVREWPESDLIHYAHYHLTND